MSSSRGQDGDERFQRVQKDPRFWEMPEREKKVKIDKRFKSMFSDERFRVTYTVDKRGRPSNHTSTEDLKRFYKVSDSEEEEEEVNRVTQKQVRKGGAEQPEEEEEEESGSSDEDEDAEDLRDLGGPDQSEEDSDSGPDLARGKGNVETSSEDEEDDVDAVLRRQEEEVEHAWGDLCRDAPRSEEVSARLAVCNLDWDRLKARDLLVLLRSFTPAGGAVLSVKIYPSDFGKERLKLEETRGPPELRALPDDSDDDTEEQRVHREKMRDYQFKRLRYFYAVVEFDSAHTAEHVYQECDGYEYESSCSCLDLRFVPDDVIFGEEEPTDVATDVDVAAYTPKLFTSSGSTTSKVQLTWDETDQERVAAMSRRFNRDELLDMDFGAYLASSSEEEPEEEEGRGEESTEKRSEEQLCKYRELLRGLQEKERRQQEDRGVDMEVTWVPGLKETTEQLVRRRLEQQEPLTPWEEFLQKKKEKKKLRRSERKQEEQQQQEEEEELPADVDLADPFFAEELTGTNRKQNVTAKKKKKKKKEEEQQTAEEQEEQQKQKEEMLLLMDDQDQHHHFNYDHIVEQQNLSRRKRRKMMRKGEELVDQDRFQVDVDDPRFQAMFTSPLFHLDPSHPAYRNTRATHSFLSEKQRRRQREEGRGQDGQGRGQDEEGRGRQREESVQQQDEQDQQEEEPVQEEEEGRAHRGATGPRMDPGLSLLVKSIKTKTEAFQRRKQKV